MQRALFVYAKLNPGLTYVQGMNELLAPIYYTLRTDVDEDAREAAEADAFWCFIDLMTEFRDNYCKQLVGAAGRPIAAVPADAHQNARPLLPIAPSPLLLRRPPRAGQQRPGRQGNDGSAEPAPGAARPRAPHPPGDDEQGSALRAHGRRRSCWPAARPQRGGEGVRGR